MGMRFRNTYRSYSTLCVLKLILFCTPYIEINDNNSNPRLRLGPWSLVSGLGARSAEKSRRTCNCKFQVLPQTRPAPAYSGRQDRSQRSFPGFRDSPRIPGPGALAPGAPGARDLSLGRTESSHCSNRHTLHTIAPRTRSRPRGSKTHNQADSHKTTPGPLRITARLTLATASRAAPSGLLRRSRLLHGSVGHDEALHLRLVAPAPLTDGRLQHADHDAIEAEHEGEQRRDRDEAEDVLVCGAERPGGAEAGAGGGARAAGWL